MRPEARPAVRLTHAHGGLGDASHYMARESPDAAGACFSLARKKVGLQIPRCRWVIT